MQHRDSTGPREKSRWECNAITSAASVTVLLVGHMRMRSGSTIKLVNTIHLSAYGNKKNFMVQRMKMNTNGAGRQTQL